MGVAAQLDVQAGARRTRQIGGHDLRGAPVEGERRDAHPAMPDRHQIGLPGLVLILEQGDRIPRAPRPGATPSGWRETSARPPALSLGVRPGSVRDLVYGFFDGHLRVEGSARFWHVQDRSLVGTVPEGGRSAQTFLCSKREYKDFLLRFRARLAGGIGNSGVNFRSKLRDPNIFSLVGPQCEICANDRTRKYPSGSLVTEPSGEPSIKPVAADVERIFKQGDFNDFEIRCVGQHVQIKLNGQTTVDADFPSMPDEGLIGWQMHGKNPPREVTFKDIEFTDFKRHPAPSGGPN